MEKALEIFLDYSKVWFGLIFIGSVLNAIAQKIYLLESTPFVTTVCFFIGFIIGLIAKIRGKWLWV
tara:strand:- start:656 stop:853 length:198 start_codon:yes stop_codon:yes gene_type:complete